MHVPTSVSSLSSTHQELRVTNKNCRTPSCEPINFHFLLPLCILSSQHSHTSGTLLGVWRAPAVILPDTLCVIRGPNVVSLLEAAPHPHIMLTQAPSGFLTKHHREKKKSFLNSSFSNNGWLLLSTSVGLPWLSNSLSKNCNVFKITRKSCREEETKREEIKTQWGLRSVKVVIFQGQPF